MTEISPSNENLEPACYMTASAMATSVNSNPRTIKRRPDGFLVTGRRRTPIFKIDPATVQEFKILQQKIYGE
jgi:hypothetical protein